ncbi:MAG: hypothetical protein K2L45_04170 [Muribaculaceae bacterium]|nr:hypothetical protein [Muribaculaceae bacterium]
MNGLTFTKAETHCFIKTIQIQQIDTMIVIDKGIFNSKKIFMNPFLKFETGGNYRAYSYLYFTIHHPDQDYQCSIFVFKENNEEPPYIRWRMGNDVSKTMTPVKELSCMIGDNENSEYLDNQFAPKDRDNDIESFQWCKKQGLVWYTLKNGDTYRLVGPQQKSH